MRIFITIILVLIWIISGLLSVFDFGYLQNQIEKFLRLESSACTVYGRLPDGSFPKFFMGSGENKKEYYCNEVE